ncbi:MAG: hemerythrin domain-containing protein [Chromatiales bacterium]|jgi:hypothetical protein
MEPFADTPPDFDDPLGLLGACHDRIRRHCEILIRLGQRLVRDGPDAEVREAAAAVHRYFALAAANHHQDEELDLFPLLRSDPELGALLDTLGGEHRAQEQAWTRLAPGLADPDAIDDPAAWARAAGAFARDNLLHVETENRLLLPRAAEMLDAAQLSGLGKAMARRRGTKDSRE